MNLLARTMTTGWRDDVDHGGEVAASDRPGQNGHAYKGTQHCRVGRHMVSMCLVSSDRWAWVEGTVTDKWAVRFVFSTQK
jgi:hypothetical protein